jgi:hypothetical protein
LAAVIARALPTMVGSAVARGLRCPVPRCSDLGISGRADVSVSRSATLSRDMSRALAVPVAARSITHETLVFCGLHPHLGAGVDVASRDEHSVEDLLMTRRSVFLVVALALSVVACKKSGSDATSKYPGTEDGAKQLLTDLRTSNDARGMTLALKPSSDDYRAVFVDDAAAKAESAYDKLWSDPKTVIAASPANTELKLYKATTDDLQKWTAAAEADFPGGYKRVAARYKPGLTLYRWKYVKPGEQLGMAFDGLVHVNGHWAWFPKPWRALGGSGGED